MLTEFTLMERSLIYLSIWGAFVFTLVILSKIQDHYKQ